MTLLGDRLRRAWDDNRLTTAMLELTYACNLDCTFCYNDLGLEGRPLSLDQYCTLLDDLAALGALQVTLTGGEPLAHPRFFEIGRRATELGFILRIKSNGHALKEPLARRVREELDPYMIEVSFHGASPAVHDRQTRVRGSFERLVSNLRVMRELGLRVLANCTMTRWNEHEMAALYALTDELGIRLNVYNEVSPRDDGDRSPLALSPTVDGMQALAALQSERAERLRRERPELFEPVKGKAAERMGATPTKHCGAGSSNVTIDPYGNVLPCVEWRRPVGNLHERRLRDLWIAGSPELDKVRASTRAAKERVKALGPAGAAMNFCPGNAFTHSGDPLALYPAAERKLALARGERVHLKIL
ncbi:MAG: radical SAM protein [Myxococcales bacterium]|nr:radical SAM protein [Myxococcales bacterium]